jgi:hypothetical protein
VTPPDDLAPRYAAGEDIMPLVRAGIGGLAGAGAALALDWLVHPPGLPRLVWPALWASAAGAGPAATTVGVAIALVLAVLAALVFVYGQFRRFVPGRPAVAGMAWAALLYLFTVPALVPWAVVWLTAAGAPEADLALRAAAGLVLETAVTLALYGAVVGVVNPARPR